MLANADLVLVAVPINVTCEVVAGLNKLPSHCVLADITSIKQAPLEAMMKAHSGPVVGLHPMFGPDVNGFVKQVVVVCHGRQQDDYQWLLNQLALWGAVCVRATPASTTVVWVLFRLCVIFQVLSMVLIYIKKMLTWSSLSHLVHPSSSRTGDGWSSVCAKFNPLRRHYFF